jgi:DNA-binding beta-propeller fold protein YncE
MKLKLSLAACLISGALAASAAEQATPPDSAHDYAIVERIAGPDGGWDYATVDPLTRKLFLGRDPGVMAYELDAKRITPVFVAGAGVHSAIPVGNTKLGLSTNGDKDSVTLFETDTGKIRGEVAVGKAPDAAVFEPKSGLVAVMNHKGGTVSLVDVKQARVIDTVKVGGELEFAVAPGDGRIFVNVADHHQIAIIDVEARKVQARFTVAGCTDPSGLAYDAATSMLISVCGNGVTKFIHSTDGAEVATIKTGMGSDAVIYDAARHLVFVPAARDGTLSVISLATPKPTIVQTLATQKGTRLGTVDPGSGTLYLPTAKMGPPVPPDPWPSVTPGTFAILVVARK